MPLQPYSEQRANETGNEGGELTTITEKDAAVERRRTPSWFPPEEAAERYRQMRSEILRGVAATEAAKLIKNHESKKNPVPEEKPSPIVQPQQRAPMAPPRRPIPVLPMEDSELSYSSEEDRPHRKPKVVPSVRRRVELPVPYIAAGLVAVLAGGLLGYGATHYRAIGAKADEIASLVKPGAATAEEPGSVTVVAKKSIATATLHVSDVSGELNSMIPLMLRAEPAVAGHDLVLKISGLPQSAYLTAGMKAEDNAWQLPAADAKDVKLVVPVTSQPSFDVAVA
ncbi:MAG TPA: hypothetical protein VMZ01_07270, partial [Aestuariivirga sp.]|nr:hypothetical protein [Aestuariivirga sp.]